MRSSHLPETFIHTRNSVIKSSVPSQKAKEFLEKLGLKVEDGFAITGVKGYLNPEKKENTSLALIGELDALRIPEHKYVNPETQAAHCCGHHAQLARHHRRGDRTDGS